MLPVSLGGIERSEAEMSEMEVQSQFWNARFRHAWELVLLLAIIYHLVLLPIRLGAVFFPTNTLATSSTSLWIFTALDYVVIALFACDIYFRCRKFGYFDDSSNQLVIEPALILAQYTQTWGFVADVLACLPLDIVALATMGFSSPGLAHPLRPLWLLVAMIKLV
jgi:hypothetical protein